MGRVLPLHEAQKFIENSVPLAKSELIGKAKETKLSFPIVLKISSRELIHKSAKGGVAFVYEKGKLEKELHALRNRARKLGIRKYEIVAQELVSGLEVLIGLKLDKVFGRVIVFGSGGVYTEIFDDVSIRKCPISLAEADDMINETLVGKILRAKSKEYDVEFLKKILVRLSRLSLREEWKDIEEVDINPFVLRARKGVAVDARAVLSNESKKHH